MAVWVVVFQATSLSMPLIVLLAVAIDRVRWAGVFPRRPGGFPERNGRRGVVRSEAGGVDRPLGASGVPRPITPGTALAAAGVSLAAGGTSLLLFADRMWVPQDRVRVGTWMWLAFPDVGWSVGWDGGVDVVTLLLELAAAVWFAFVVWMARGVLRDWRQPLLEAERRATERFTIDMIAAGAAAWFALQVAASCDDLAFTLIALQAISWMTARIPGLVREWSNGIAHSIGRPTGHVAIGGVRHTVGADSQSLALPLRWLDGRLLAWWWFADFPAAVALVMLSAHAVGWSAAALADDAWVELLRSEPAVANTVAFGFAMTVLGRCGLLPWVGVLPRLNRLCVTLRRQIDQNCTASRFRIRWRARMQPVAMEASGGGGDTADAEKEDAVPGGRPEKSGWNFDRTLALPALAVQAVYAAQAVAATVVLWRLVPLWQSLHAGPASVGTLAALSCVWLGLIALTSAEAVRVSLSVAAVHAALMVAYVMADPFVPAPSVAVLFGLLGAGFATAVAWNGHARSVENAPLECRPHALPRPMGVPHGEPAVEAQTGGGPGALHVPAALLTLGLSGAPLLLAGFPAEGGNAVAGRLLLVGWLLVVFAVWRMSCRTAWASWRSTTPVAPTLGWCCILVLAAVFATPGVGSLWADRWPALVVRPDEAAGLATAGEPGWGGWDAARLARAGLVLSLSGGVAVVAWMRFRQPWALPGIWRRRFGAALRLLENELYVEAALDGVAQFVPAAIALLRSVSSYCVARASEWMARRCVRPLLEMLDTTRSEDHETVLVPMAVLVAVGLILAALWGSSP